MSLPQTYLTKLIPQIFIFPLLCILGQKISSRGVRCFFKVNIARLIIQTVLYSQIHCLDSGWQNFLAWCSLFQIPLWSLPVLTMYKNLGFSCCPQSQRKLVCWTLPFPSTHDKFLHRPIFLKEPFQRNHATIKTSLQSCIRESMINKRSFNHYVYLAVFLWE